MTTKSIVTLEENYKRIEGILDNLFLRGMQSNADKIISYFELGVREEQIIGILPLMKNIGDTKGDIEDYSKFRTQLIALFVEYELKAYDSLIPVSPFRIRTMRDNVLEEFERPHLDKIKDRLKVDGEFLRKTMAHTRILSLHEGRTYTMKEYIPNVLVSPLTDILEESYVSWYFTEQYFSYVADLARHYFEIENPEDVDDYCRYEMAWDMDYEFKKIYAEKIADKNSKEED